MQKYCFMNGYWNIMLWTSRQVYSLKVLRVQRHFRLIIIRWQVDGLKACIWNEVILRSIISETWNQYCSISLDGRPRDVEDKVCWSMFYVILHMHWAHQQKSRIHSEHHERTMGLFTTQVDITHIGWHHFDKTVGLFTDMKSRAAFTPGEGLQEDVHD